MQSGLWLYSNTPSRLRNQLSSAKMNSAQSGRVWRFAPGGFSVGRTEHTGATQLLLSIPPPLGERLLLTAVSSTRPSLQWGSHRRCGGTHRLRVRGRSLADDPSAIL